MNKPALKGLVSPHSVDEFLDRHWPNKSKYFLAEGTLARLPKFLHSKELSSFEALARVYKGGTAFVNATKSHAAMPADSRSALKLYKMGLSVFFDDIGRCVPGATDFLRELERDLGVNAGAARMTSWASPCDNGVAPHYDANEVISIQLIGTKNFELAPAREIPNPYGGQYTAGARPHPDTYPQMTRGFPDWHDVEFEAVDMKPGSVLFYPRGTWHRTNVSADSLAVAIVIEPPPAVDCVLEQLRFLMLQNPRWREPLYNMWSIGPERETALAHAAELLQEIPAIARAVSPEDLLLPTLPEEYRLASIDRNSRFQRIPLTGVAVEKSVEPTSDQLVNVHITIKDEHDVEHIMASIEIPRPYTEVVNWLADQHAPFYAHAVASKFPAIAFDDHKKLLEMCARANLLKLLWFPSLEEVPAAHVGKHL